MELALDLGADDVATDEEAYEIFTTVEDFHRVRDELERRGVPRAAEELAMVPQSWVALRDQKASQALRLMEALEDHDDVQKVWANFDVDAGVLAAHAG
jgi:transcriptional/translational regulatory protein YebC/TACO1